MTNEELVIRIKAGIDVSDNMLQLYKQIKRFIYQIAKRFQAYEDIDDLQQEGYLALYDAIDGYDPDTGNKFLTYASWHIRQRMGRYIQDKGSCLRLPIGKQGKMQQYRKLHNWHMMELGREPTIRETAYHLDLSLEQAEELKDLAITSKLGSLDAPVKGLDGREDTAVGDMVADPHFSEDDIIERMQQEQLHETLWRCVDGLEGRQPDVMRKRYIENKTLKEIAEDYGVNPELIRQDQAKGLRELRKPKNQKWLNPYFEDIRSSAMTGILGILKGATRKKRTAREQREITTEARGNYERFSIMNKERTKEDASRNEILYKPVKVILTEY